jgi:hypothetical protein
VRTEVRRAFGVAETGVHGLHEVAPEPIAGAIVKPRKEPDLCGEDERRLSPNDGQLDGPTQGVTLKASRAKNAHAAFGSARVEAQKASDTGIEQADVRACIHHRDRFRPRVAPAENHSNLRALPVTKRRRKV